MSSVRRTFIPDIFLHQCCQHSLHNLSVMRRKSTPDKKKHHHKNTKTPPQKHNHTTTKTPRQKHKNTTTKTPPHHHKNTTTKTQKHHQKRTPQKRHHRNTTTKTQPHHHKNTTTKNTTTTPPPTPPPQKTPPPTPPPPPQKHHHTHTTTTTKTPPHHHESSFYHSFERPTRTKWRKGCLATWKMPILPQFWASGTHEVTKGSFGEVTNLHFATVLSVRHARSDERVARRAQKFAFYHSFEHPARTKWRKGRSAKWQICILPQFWASDTHQVTKRSLGHAKNLHFTTVLNVRHARSDERSGVQVKNLHFTTVLSVRHARSHERVVKSTGAIPAPRQKKTIFQDFFRGFWLAVFLCSLFSCPFL